MLAEQNLRPTATGGHRAVELAMAAQLAGGFGKFRNLRRRRNELDCPSGEEDFADDQETRSAIRAVGDIVDNARQILEQGVLTSF